MATAVAEVNPICVTAGRASVRSYLVESNEGFVRPWLPSSHTLLASSFPMEDITLISSMGQSSRSSDLTRERWVPRFRWIPEHSIHMRAPKFKLAQLGSTEERQEQNSVRTPPVTLNVPEL